MRDTVVALARRGFPWLLMASVAMGAVRFGVGCSGWDPTKPFERNAPDVDRALQMIEQGDYDNAEEVLSQYLGTGVCNAGEIGLPATVRERPDGSFDLSLVLFYLGERYGRRFGDEEKGEEGKEDDPATVEKRDHEVRCALLVAMAIASDSNVPLELRARAYYLAGNLEFLRRNYADAIKQYEQSLKIVPGIIEEAGGDGIGRDAAWNRAVALRRLENEDAGPDSGPDAEEPDAGPDAEEDANPDKPDGADDGGDDAGDAGDGGDDAGDAGQDGGDDGGDAGQDGGDGGDGGDEGDAGQDAGKDAGQDGGSSQDPNQPQDPSDGDPDEPNDSQAPQRGDRILDRFEESPSYQQEEAKRQAERGRRRGMEDK